MDHPFNPLARWRATLTPFWSQTHPIAPVGEQRSHQYVGLPHAPLVLRQPLSALLAPQYGSWRWSGKEAMQWKLEEASSSQGSIPAQAPSEFQGQWGGSESWSEGIEEMNEERSSSQRSASISENLKSQWSQWMNRLPQVFSGVTNRLGGWWRQASTLPARRASWSGRQFQQLDAGKAEQALQRRYTFSGGEGWREKLRAQAYPLTPHEKTTLDKLKEAQSLLALANSARTKGGAGAQQAAVYAQERAVARFLEAYKIEAQKLAEKELSLPGHFFAFRSARRSQPYPTLQSPYAAKGTLQDHRPEDSELGQHLRLKSVRQWAQRLRPSSPSAAFYHEFQSGPYCQTVAVNNYLGAELFSPELAHLWVESLGGFSAAQLSDAPAIHEDNRNAIHRRLMQHLVETAVRWGFDPEMLQTVVRQMDVVNRPLRKKGGSAQEVHACLRKVWAEMQAYQVDRALLTFSEEKSGVGHIVALRRIPGKERWVLLDGNQPPVEIDLQELCKIWADMPMVFTLQFPNPKSDWSVDNLHTLKTSRSSSLTASQRILPPKKIRLEHSELWEAWEEAGFKSGVLNYIGLTLEKAAYGPGGLSKLFAFDPAHANWSQESPQALAASLRNAQQGLLKIPPFFLEQAQHTQAAWSRLSQGLGLQSDPSWRDFEQRWLALQNPKTLQDPQAALGLLKGLLPAEATRSWAQLVDFSKLSPSFQDFLKEGGARKAFQGCERFLAGMKSLEQRGSLDGFVGQRLERWLQSLTTLAQRGARTLDPARTREALESALQALNLPSKALTTQQSQELESKVLSLLPDLTQSLPIFTVQKGWAQWGLSMRHLFQTLAEPQQQKRLAQAIQNRELQPEELLNYLKTYAWAQWQRICMRPEAEVHFRPLENLPLPPDQLHKLEEFEKTLQNKVFREGSHTVYNLGLYTKHDNPEAT